MHLAVLMTEHNVKVQEWVIRFDGNITHKQAALEIDLGETGDDMQGIDQAQEINSTAD